MAKELWLRCPRLGGEVPFSYCLKEGGDLPCPRTIMCWKPFFPIDSYLWERLGPEKWNECFAGQHTNKVASLVECIERAKGGAED